MSLRHALFGLLAENPASGWDLTRRFEELLGSVWPAGHLQIYGELGRLEADGFIEIESEGPRRRRTYRPTESGIREVRRWLTEAGLRINTALDDSSRWAIDHQPQQD